MRRFLPMSLIVAAALSASFGAETLPAAGGSSEAKESPIPLEVWNDPTFQKQFLGSYGTNAAIEPQTTAPEKEHLQKILTLMQTDQDAAATEIETLLQKALVQSAVFDFTLANIRFQQDAMEKAITHYEEAIRKFPSFLRAHKNLGIIRVRQGELDVAIKSLTRVVELGGSDGLIMGLLGYCYSASGQHVSAESAYRSAVLLQPDVLDWKIGLTQSALKQEKYEEVVSLCADLIERVPDRSEFWMLQANAWIGLGQPLKAAENFEILARMGKANARSMRVLGDIYINEGMPDLAVRAYTSSVTLDPDAPPDDSLRRVEALAQRGALSQARALLAEIAKSPVSAEPVTRTRMLKLQARIEVAEGNVGAVIVLEEIVALDPLDGEALLLLGQHYERVADPEKAIFYYERAESIEANEADARVRHARLLVNQSRYGEALPLLKRAQELRPRDEVARFIEQVERAARSQR